MAIHLARHALPRLASRFRAHPIAYHSLPVPRISSFKSQTEHRLRIRMAHTQTPDTLDPSVLIEEETVRGYRGEDYYPVKVGELFQGRYSVIGKLGYGSASTVWLCHDLRKDGKYVALKVYINRSKVHRELPVYNHINSLRSEHEGRYNVRRLLDNFKINGPGGTHTCLVHEALGMNLEELRELIPGRMFAADLIRQSFRDILRGMHFLHEEANVIHTG